MLWLGGKIGVGREVVEKVDKFCMERVGVEVALETKERRYRKLDDREYQMFYLV
jgi:hypothetical protein